MEKLFSTRKFGIFFGKLQAFGAPSQGDVWVSTENEANISWLAIHCYKIPLQIYSCHLIPHHSCAKAKVSGPDKDRNKPTTARQANNFSKYLRRKSFERSCWRYVITMMSAYTIHIHTLLMLLSYWYIFQGLLKPPCENLYLATNLAHQTFLGLPDSIMIPGIYKRIMFNLVKEWMAHMDIHR